MEVSMAPPPSHGQAPTSNNNPGRSNRRRRNRRPRGGQTQTDASADTQGGVSLHGTDHDPAPAIAHSMAPISASSAYAAPFVPSVSPADLSSAENSSSRAQSSRRRGQRPIPSHGTHLVVNRSFGAQLTSAPGASSEEESRNNQNNNNSGQPSRSRNSRQKNAQATPQPPREPRTVIDRAQVENNSRRNRQRWQRRNAPVVASEASLNALLAFPVADLSNRIHEEIDSGEYECPICTVEVDRKAAVWYCRTCWVVFHFSCLKTWADSQYSTTPAEGELPVWRCPGCNLPQKNLPAIPTCWCEKESNPKSISGLPPLSCGQTCSRSRPNCPHPCSSVCHAGPCPPCRLTLPPKDCFCGRQSEQQRCSTSKGDSGWSCGQACGKWLSCGDHQCSDPCHDGPCSPCLETIPSTCYCGLETRDLVCSDRGVLKQSTVDGPDGTKSWTGAFSCEAPCTRKFDCGLHSCTKGCHPQEKDAGHCPYSTDVVSHCACGKSSLESMSVLRSSCTDPIPSCSKECLKVLSCGHLCSRVCHADSCGPCGEVIQVECQCGKTQSSSLCHQGMSFSRPMCPRVCYTTMSCGKHTCMERCCSGQKQALERLKRTKRTRIDAVEVPFETEHICTNVCNAKLPCGTHTCEDPCHKGRCPPCPEAIFDDISCNCGKTVLFAPLPCGTKPPTCKYRCERPRACGHAQVVHNCHQDDEQCPKCPYLTTKVCLCQKNQLKNQPCWVTEARCTETCKRLLKCGAHRCSLGCHVAGGCENTETGCGQICGKTKSCGHVDTAMCHGASACAEESPCQHKIMLFCLCQRVKQEVKCLGFKGGKGNMDKILSCDGECARLQRNRALASALNITEESDPEAVSYSAATLSYYSKNPAWCDGQEELLQKLATEPNEKQVRFPPMALPKREFIHSLSLDFGLDSQSLDPEPHRHVVVFKTPKFVGRPRRSLAETVRLQCQQKTQARQGVLKLRAGESSQADVPFNAYVISDPKFGLTIADVWAALKPLLRSYPAYQLEIDFIPSGEVIVSPASMNNDTFVPNRGEIRRLLTDLRSDFCRVAQQNGFGSVRLCVFDQPSQTVSEYEHQAPSAAAAATLPLAATTAMRPAAAAAAGEVDGWNTIVTKSAKPKTRSDGMMAGSSGWSTPTRYPFQATVPRTVNQFGSLGGPWAQSMSPTAVANKWTPAQPGASSWADDFGTSVGKGGGSSSTGGGGTASGLKDWTGEPRTAAPPPFQAVDSILPSSGPDLVTPAAAVAGEHSKTDVDDDDDVVDDWEDEADELDDGAGQRAVGAGTEVGSGPPRSRSDLSLFRGRGRGRGDTGGSGASSRRSQAFALESTPSPSPSPSASPTRSVSPGGETAAASKPGCVPS